MMVGIVSILASVGVYISEKVRSFSLKSFITDLNTAQIFFPMAIAIAVKKTNKYD